MGTFRIMTVNCQGLGDSSKRKDVLNYLKSRKHNIYCLQDTHFKKSLEPYIQAQWGYKCIFSSYTTNARGVAILLNNNFEYKIHKQELDGTGNYIILDITIEGERMTLINLYGPNEDNPVFYDNIFKCIREFDNEKYLICGDFNLTLDQQLDTYNYRNINNPNSKKTISENLEYFNLTDPFRELYPDLRKYTWRKKNPIKQARLDFFLISNNLMFMVRKIDIENSYRSDHSGVVLHMKINELKKGPGLWKFNNLLLRDKDYVKEIKKVITDVKIQYSVPVYNVENINKITNENLVLTINDQLFLDTLLMEIRGKTISYSSFKKKEQSKLENKLIEDIKILEANENMINSDILEDKRMELLDIRKLKLKGQQVRSRAQWIEDGEKPTKYFCNMESRNYYSKLITKLETEQGHIITDQKNILKETKNFYKRLYSKKPGPQNYSILEKLETLNFNTLTDDDAAEIEGKITHDEALKFLKKMKNDKSPGSDGFTTEFLKFFWIDLGHFIVRYINHSYDIEELSVTQKLGIITCIPKTEKVRHFLKNWRPISLLNTIYKIASGCIAHRLKLVLDKIIDHDQTGFINGRFIGENTRLIYDIMHYTETHNIPGLLLLVDFEKAFDSISWSFIDTVLNIFNFKCSIKSWIKTLYKNSLSAVIQNGYLSESFILERGCRQGDPLSPYIFILCAEILAILVRNSKDIKGITIDGEQFLISQYADDTSFILDGSPRSLAKTMEILDYYADISGLKLNYSKTKVIWIGSKKFSKTVYHHSRWKLEWGSNSFKLLGVNFDVNLSQMLNKNFEEKLNEIKNLIKHWQSRKLTVLGKITVVKTLLVPKITHLFMSLPNPTGKYLEELNTLLYKFVWDNKPEKVKRDIITQDYCKGGLKMMNLMNYIMSLKSSWLGRLITSNSRWTKLFECINHCNIHDIINYGDAFVRKKLTNIRNPFWKDVLIGWQTILERKIPNDTNDVYNSSLWYNTKITVGRRSVAYKNYIDKGILLIKDVLDEQGNLMSYDEFRQKYVINTNFLEYNSLLRAIKSYMHKYDNQETLIIDLQKPSLPDSAKLLLSNRKGSKAIYNVINKTNCIPIAQSKYEIMGLVTNTQVWNKYYILPFKCSKSTDIQWFQYRILHRILGTNYLLYKIKYISSDKCTFCKRETETMEHLFFECQVVKEFWNSVCQWIYNVLGIIIPITICNILFGIPERHAKVINWFILQVKQYIYSMKIQEKKLNIYALQNIISGKLAVEKFLLFKNCQFKEYNNIWAKWISLVH